MVDEGCLEVYYGEETASGKTSRIYRLMKRPLAYVVDYQATEAVSVLALGHQMIDTSQSFVRLIDLGATRLPNAKTNDARSVSETRLKVGIPTRERQSSACEERQVLSTAETGGLGPHLTTWRLSFSMAVHRNRLDSTFECLHRTVSTACLRGRPVFAPLRTCGRQSIASSF